MLAVDCRYFFYSVYDSDFGENWEAQIQTLSVVEIT